MTQTQKSVKIEKLYNIFNVCQSQLCEETDYNTPACTFYTKVRLSRHISQRPFIIDIFVTRILDLMHCRLLKEF